MHKQKFIIEGGKRISGELQLQGAKNSSLPIIAASVMCRGETILKNCPQITDTYASCRILTQLGCKCSMNDDTLTIINDGVIRPEIPDELMREMRSSIIFMGALVGSQHECRLSFPGGCELGPRPIDMHLSAIKKMGGEIKDVHGNIECIAISGLHGAKITLSYPSVGTTENIILAAVLANGETIIANAAREPEIVDLAKFLNNCGAKIRGAGNSTIVIEGVNELHGCEYKIMPDRIAAATYISAAVCTGGEINLKGVELAVCDSFISVFEQMGCGIYEFSDSVYVNAKKIPKAVKKIITLPHPGFPTDAQAVVMAALCKARGISIFEETVFENRYRHVDYLVKMGADIKVIGKAAVVSGVKKLYGTKIKATDLRGGAAMVIAALGAEGISELYDIEHIDRGYENFEKYLCSLGGKVIRV